MTGSRLGVVEHTIRIAARPEIVFGLLTDAKQMLRWQGLEAEVEPQPGGVYRVRMNAVGETASGRFVEVTPYSRVVFSWGWETDDSPVPPGSSTVEITLTQDGEGTVLHLLHHGLPPVAEVTEPHAEGWMHYLSRLATVAEDRVPGPDDWADGSMGGLRPE